MVFDPTRDNVVIKAPWFWQLVLEGEDHFVHKDYDQRHVINSALIFFRPVALMLAFAALWGLCVMQFEMKGINYALVLGINKDELAKPSHIFKGVFYLFVIWAFFAFAYVRAAQHEVTGFLLPVVLCYIVIGYLVFTKSYSFMKASRGFLSTHLYNCIVVPDKHVPFIEVLVADGLTSLSKVFFDFGVIGLTLYGMAMRGFDMDKMDVVGKAATFHLLPYLLWSVPYIIRANQCLICAKHTADAHARRNHYLNTMKYMSIFPVIIFSTLSRLYGDSPYIGIYHNITLVATFVNCAYCFTWDVTMDWGLAQPRAKHAGLRNVLLYQRPHLYYLALAADLTGRLFWTIKWLPGWGDLDMGDWEMAKTTTFVSQLIEVLRRIMWNLYRVEWQCVKEDPEAVSRVLELQQQRQHMAVRTDMGATGDLFNGQSKSGTPDAKKTDEQRLSSMENSFPLSLLNFKEKAPPQSIPTTAEVGV